MSSIKRSTGFEFIALLVNTVFFSFSHINLRMTNEPFHILKIRLFNMIECHRKYKNHYDFY